MRPPPSAPRRVDIDRLAREAIPDTSARPDLFTTGFPFEPALWWIVVEPRKPKSVSEGGIEFVDVSTTAESFQASIGRVLKAGPSALEGKTSAGIELKNFLDGVTSREQLIGSWVIYQQHVGQRLRLARTDQIVIVMKVTDLLGTTADPDAWRFYL